MRSTPLLLAALLTSNLASAMSADRLVSSYQFVEPEAAGFAYSSDTSDVVVFLNRWGGLYVPGKNDSRTNTTSLIDSPTIMPPFIGTDRKWDELIDCVNGQFENFRVRVTDKDPGLSPHYEAVVSGVPGDIDQPDHIGGISPFRLDCGVIDNSVVFVFAELFDDNTQRLCEIVAQEVAHSFGLDHQMNCSDPMSYLGGCGEKSFQNQDAECGEYEARECACGQASQNSVKTLALYLGDAVAPELDIPEPQDGSTVNPSFYVDVRAEDNVGVDRVELYADGVKVASRGNGPFVFGFEGELSDGQHQLEVRVYDGENVTTRSLSVTVDPNAEMQPVPTAQIGGLQGGMSDVQGGCSTGGSSSPLLVLMALAALRLRRGGFRVRATA